MKKLQLDLESLTVMTFATDSEEEVLQGTVHALQTGSGYSCPYPNCQTHEITGCDCVETGPLYLTCDNPCTRTEYRC